LPITKNASTTFTMAFKTQGWQLQQLDQLGDDYHIFGHLRDPIERHFKGTAEFLVKNNLSRMLQDPEWQKIYTHAVMDIHSYPITWSLGSRADKIKWIPISKKISTNYLTQRYLKSHQIDINLLSVLWYEVPSIEKQQVYLELQKLHGQLNTNHLAFFYDSDIILWNKTVPYLDEDNIRHFVN